MSDMENRTQAETQSGENERTFTQEEVNRIVSERLNREKEKNATELEKRERELNERERAFNAKQIMDKHKLPDVFMNTILNAEDMEETAKSIISGINEYQPAPNMGYTPARGNTPITDYTREAFGLNS